MSRLNRYPSKVMLVGEYGVVAGGSALTIPFPTFYAQVREATQIPLGQEQVASASISYLKKLFSYISRLSSGTFHAPPDLERFSEHLERYWLEMTIPTGYGLGSSGAVSAAIYDLFFTNSRNVTLLQQKEDLAVIESYFHGKSSGVDALTCFVGKPLQFSENGTIAQVGFDPSQIPGGYRFFLIDSGVCLDTGPLVSHFLQQMEDPGFASSIRNEYLVFNQKLIESLLGEREADPGLLMRVLSDFQLTHFRKMIPDSMVDLWLEGQVSNDYYLKLNGSGGGYMLGIMHHTVMESMEERWKSLIWIK